MVLPVGDSGVWRTFDKVVGLKGDDKEIRPDRVRFSTEVDYVVCVFDARDVDVAGLQKIRKSVNILPTHKNRKRRENLTLSTRVGRMTLRKSFHKPGLNFKHPSLSNSRNLVSFTQSSPKRLLEGSSPMALNQSSTENKLSEWNLYFLS